MRSPRPKSPRPCSSRLPFLALLAVIAATAAAAAATPADPSKEAALGWLALVDGGRYGESWDRSGTMFRTAVTREDWARQLGAVRSPLGAVSKRTVSHSQRASSLPGAPDGEYVVFSLDTSFAKKRSAVETVTVVREDDGEWRVVGYYIK